MIYLTQKIHVFTCVIILKAYSLFVYSTCGIYLGTVLLKKCVSNCQGTIDNFLPRGTFPNSEG